MTWPAGSKAGTTNVDAGSDKPALARADIKQNIDNVNSIIDTFDIASPSNGDILTYNSTSGAWEPGAASAGGTQLAFISRTSGEESVSGNIYRLAYIENADSGILTTTSSYQFTLSAGSYYFDALNYEQDAGTGGANTVVQLYNETDSVLISNIGYNEIGTTGEGLRYLRKGITFASSTTCSFRVDEADITTRNAVDVSLTIYKI